MVNDHRTRAQVTFGRAFTPATPEVYGETILAMVPTLLVTITTPVALRTWLRAWTIASQYANRVWTAPTLGVQEDAHDANRLSLALRLDTAVAVPTVRATTPAGDLHGRGRVSLTVDPLHIEIIHGAAWHGLWTTWREVYTAGEQLWELPPFDTERAISLRWWRHQRARQRHGL
ncbi:hypothetical protein [Nocardiopsis dassonvillei]|uniref:hypothetical protein n=1 Tax=Nocardiopsis dassonvillei TaxID=2014 RepID=UPI00362B6C8E